MRVKDLTLSLAVAICLFNAGAGAQSRSEDRATSAGHSIAVTTCISCHVVSPDQSLKPVLGPGIPSFEEIANRPNTTTESLTATMKMPGWHDPGITATLLPMTPLSDNEKVQVATYITSLRTNR
jgi:mono/diheme cytochrome c family protein